MKFFKLVRHHKPKHSHILDKEALMMTIMTENRQVPKQAIHKRCKCPTIKMVHFNNKRSGNENKIFTNYTYKIKRHYMKKKALLHTFYGSLYWYNFFHGKLTTIIDLKCLSFLTNNSTSRNLPKEGSIISVYKDVQGQNYI